MKSTIEQKFSMLGIALVIAVLGLMVLQDRKLADNEYLYELSDSDRLHTSTTEYFNTCEHGELDAKCFIINFEKDDELIFSFSLWTKQTVVGGALNEVNDIRPDTFRMEQYSIGRSLRWVNGQNAPFYHTAYWTFRSDTHKDCASSDGTEGRCNYGMDSLVLEKDETLRIFYQYI